ncbi:MULTISPECIES: hypothetical protein [Paenibacillus]|jgi:hypothetical protein|nr:MULTISPECIES: hypothetical protein [Paenibacillus]MBP1309519.1 Ethanolamine utilization protein EutJ (predicted chaperonin) [Paenibacillus sp. 1182]MDY8093599.1 hypothetical protein [Paenibacillus polymyxa]
MDISTGLVHMSLSLSLYHSLAIRKAKEARRFPDQQEIDFPNLTEVS